MAYGGMNDDIIDDVTWPWKVMVVTQYFKGPLFRKRLEIETQLQWGTYRKWHTRYRMVTWLMTSHYPESSKSWP